MSATRGGSAQISAALERCEFATALGVTSPGAITANWGDVDRVWPWASVSKVGTALGILRAVELGVLSLDAGGEIPGATLADLLAHCSGIAFDDDTLVAAVGARRVYSNRGIELAARMVTRHTGIDFDIWLETQVFAPLGMKARLRTSPAYGVYGSVRDLLALGRELLAPTLISAELSQLLATCRNPGLAGVVPGFGRHDDCQWGLGVEIRGAKQPHWTAPNADPATFGHFGVSGSFLWVDRGRERAAAFLGDQSFSAIHRQVWPELNTAILAAIDAGRA